MDLLASLNPLTTLESSTRTETLAYFRSRCPTGSPAEISAVFDSLRAADAAVYPCDKDVGGVSDGDEYMPCMEAHAGAFSLRSCGYDSLLASHGGIVLGRACSCCDPTLGPSPKVTRYGVLIHDECLPRFISFFSQFLRAEALCLWSCDEGAAFAVLPREVVALICCAM